MGTTPAATLTSQLDNESRTKQMGQVGRCPPAPFLTETHNASGAQAWAGRRPRRAAPAAVKAPAVKAAA